jgi:hypothetical protein
VLALVELERQKQQDLRDQIRKELLEEIEEAKKQRRHQKASGLVSRRGTNEAADLEMGNMSRLNSNASARGTSRENAE